MTPARIAELLQPFLSPSPNPAPSPDPAPSPNPCHSEPAKAGEEPAFPSPAQLQSISTYIALLLRWNARINLTAIRDPEEIVTRHFGESLFAARHLFPSSSSVSPVSPVVKAFDSANHQRRVADLGSGAGFPGVPLKLWAPHIALTLIESNHKKATFLREAVRMLTLTDVDVFHGRAEDLSARLVSHGGQSKDLPPGGYDLVTLRAVERFATILPTAAHLVVPGGRLALLISAPQAAIAQTTISNFLWDQPLQIPRTGSRILLVGTRPA